MRARLYALAARLRYLAYRAWKAWDDLGSTRHLRHGAVAPPPAPVRPRTSSKQWTRIAAMTL